ncbi:phosphatidate cytidylyltransferase [Paracoccus tegillarcae]|uniref:Phosphatidate cytidylyltransferase n=1 Tax=Paracoccus tegillarcae TaxID=1529068 RepID=A0A2K9EI98_9RHOB|nr:phosphatidate cytidylyltransferase [Paracoccus tegillarcae]AUH34703.1 phosphatidate cytidylyltransferase [Paracoccus tegillarcae]
MTQKSASGRWSDLGRRITSAAILLGIGLVLALSTGVTLRLFMSCFVALTFWELANMTGWRHPSMHDTPFGRSRPMVLAGLAGVALMIALSDFSLWVLPILAIPILAGLPGAISRDRLTYAVFGMAILLVGYGLVGMREEFGLPFVLWLIGAVFLSDILGYFAGKYFGGPKFWPAVSPKKTWSGTIAGWVGGVILGTLIWLSGHGDPALIWVTPMIIFAGQMGDIAESWLKRRAGVKDSSNLIPGHGGFMDRFDAVSGAVLLVLLISLVMQIPQLVF